MKEQKTNKCDHMFLPKCALGEVKHLTINNMCIHKEQSSESFWAFFPHKNQTNKKIFLTYTNTQIKQNGTYV